MMCIIYPPGSIFFGCVWCLEQSLAGADRAASGLHVPSCLSQKLPYTHHQHPPACTPQPKSRVPARLRLPPLSVSPSRRVGCIYVFPKKKKNAPNKRSTVGRTHGVRPGTGALPCWSWPSPSPLFSFRRVEVLALAKRHGSCGDRRLGSVRRAALERWVCIKLLYQKNCSVCACVFVFGSTARENR